LLTSPDATRVLLEEHGYFADDALATSIFLAVRMGKPLFLEGEPGVGKTDLLKRPLLQAIDAAQDRAPVLLIDELDRADEEFESFLLELLSDFQITIPELGTLKARHRPVVILTSNRTREIHDALKRRCAYCWIDYPARDKELQIVRAKSPGVDAQLSEQIVRFVQVLRKQDLYKLPGIAETIDWAEALRHLNTHALDAVAIDRTLGLVLKYQDDVDKIRGEAAGRLLQEALA
jgi:MoxR-like ATPase